MMKDTHDWVPVASADFEDLGVRFREGPTGKLASYDVGRLSRCLREVRKIAGTDRIRHYIDWRRDSVVFEAWLPRENPWLTYARKVCEDAEAAKASGRW